MCETNGHSQSSAPKQLETMDDDVYNDQQNVLVKFDIGQFVHNHRKIQLLLGPWVRLFNTVLNITHWKSPYVSLFWLLLSCFLAVCFPICFLTLPFFYLVIIMSLSAIKNKGKQKKKTVQRTIRKKDDNNDLNVKATCEKQVKEDIKEFITLLIHLEALTLLITKALEETKRIIKWEDFKTSLSIFLGMLFAILTLLLVPLSVLLVLAVLSLFCLNVGFKPVAEQAFMLIKDVAKNLLSLLGLMELFATKPDRQISASSIDEEEWHDAEINREPDQSSDEDDSDVDIHEESAMSRKKLQDSSSILSQLADYRRKQKKLNSGKCCLCDVPFSSILKKRQYCRHCGESFCSKCCSHRVKRSVFGATAPAAYEETVLVCKACFDLLMNANVLDQQTGTASW